MELSLDTTSHKILQHFSGQMPQESAELSVQCRQQEPEIHWDLIGLTNTKTSLKYWKETGFVSCLYLIDDMDIIHYEHLEHFHLYVASQKLPQPPGFSAQATIPAQTSNVSKTLAKSCQNFHLNFWTQKIPPDFTDCSIP